MSDDFDHQLSAIIAEGAERQQELVIRGENLDRLIDLIKYVKKLGEFGHTFPIVVDPEDSRSKRKFVWDGDGNNRIMTIKFNGKILKG